MKKWLCFALATLMLLCVGCGKAEEEPERDREKKVTTTRSSVVKTTWVLTTIPVTTTTTTTTTAVTTTTTTAPEVFITASKAMEIAAKHFGIQPGTRDEATGNMMSYCITQTATKENPYFVVALQWLVMVNGQPDHQSVLDTVTIHAVSGMISE